MNFIQDSVRCLSARLPELEWRLVALNISLTHKKLPAGLFHPAFELTPQACIQEIKADLCVLENQKNERSARFLADRIDQKINVLVRLCQLQANKANIPVGNSHFVIKAISTRQQWLQNLQQHIDQLSEQEQALQNTLVSLEQKNDAKAVLSIKASLGELERRLTLARELFTRATATMSYGN